MSFIYDLHKKHNNYCHRSLGSCHRSLKIRRVFNFPEQAPCNLAGCYGGKHKYIFYLFLTKIQPVEHNFQGKRTKLGPRMQKEVQAPAKQSWNSLLAATYLNWKLYASLSLFIIQDYLQQICFINYFDFLPTPLPNFIKIW